ncbi:MAG: hypothetical protein ACPG45_10980 [Flavobacteriaceae bacterium]
MKKKIKNYLKLGALLLGISIVIISCQMDDYEPEQEPLADTNQLGLTVQRSIKPDLSSNKALLSKIDDINKKARSNRGSSREVYNSEMDFYVDTEVANYVEYGAYHSYTFPVYRDEDNGLIENLFLSLQADGSYKSVLTQYNLTEEEIENYKNGIEVDLTDKTNGILLDDISWTNSLMNRTDSCVQVSVETYCHDSEGNEVIDTGANNGEPGECWGNWRHDVTVYDFSLCDLNSGGGGGGTTSGTGTGTDSSNDTGTGPGGISGTGTGPSGTSSGTPDDDTDNNSNDNTDSEDNCLQVSIDGDCFQDSGVLILPPRPEPDPDPCKNPFSGLEQVQNEVKNLRNTPGYPDAEDGKKFYYTGPDVFDNTTYTDTNLTPQLPNKKFAEGLKFPSPEPITICGVHFHPALTIFGPVRKVPSGLDLAEHILMVQQLAQEYPGTELPSLVTNFVVSQEGSGNVGTTYVLNVENLQSILGITKDYSKRKNREKLRDEVKDLINTVNDTQYNQHENLLSTFIEGKFPGIGLYKAVYDDNGDIVDCIKL